MKINNDIITFDAADFADMSPFAQKALAAFVGERLDFTVVFAEDLNAKVNSAKAHLRHLTSDNSDVQAIVASLAAADDAKRAEVQPLIDQLKGSFLPGKGKISAPLKK